MWPKPTSAVGAVTLQAQREAVHAPLAAKGSSIPLRELERELFRVIAIFVGNGGIGRQTVTVILFHWEKGGERVMAKVKGRGSGR